MGTSPVYTALCPCWEPKETLRRSLERSPKGARLLPSALWPHGGAAVLRVCTARGSTALSGVRPRWLTCRLGVMGGGEGAF